MLLMELGQFWMIFTIGVSWLCLIPAKSVQTVYIAPVFFIALWVMGMGYCWLLTVSAVLQSLIKLARAQHHHSTQIISIPACMHCLLSSFFSEYSWLSWDSWEEREISGGERWAGKPVVRWGEVG